MDHGDVAVGLKDLPDDGLGAFGEFERAALALFQPVVVQGKLDDHKVCADIRKLRDQERARDGRDRAHVGAMKTEVHRGVVADRRSHVKV